MKTIDDSLEWHDENELVRRLDVVEAVLNLADTIDDVVDVIMSVPTYKVQTSTNVAMGSDSISTKADRKTEPQIIKVGMATDSVTGKVLGVTLDTDCAWR